MSDLSEQQKKFIKFYIETGKARDSAIRAGYSQKNASKAARSLLKENKKVMAALQQIREKKDKPAEYDLKAAMAECDEQIAMAKATENASSFLGGITLKAKLMKILDDKPASAQFQIMISGIGGDSEQKTVISVNQSQPNLLTGDVEE